MMGGPDVWTAALAPILWGLNAFVFTWFLALHGSYLLTSATAFRSIRRYAERLRTLDLREAAAHQGAPPITLVAPAFNEAETVVESVRALLSLEYPQHEVIVVNDGSADATLERLVEAYELEPFPRMSTFDIDTARIRATYRSRRHQNLVVVDKENGGKADALNAGLCFCRTPLFCALDADTLLERDALTRLARPFLEDARTVAAGGTIRIVNGCTVSAGRVTETRLPDHWLARLQVLEYLRAFLVGRLGWDAIDGNIIISGAFGMFRRALVVEAGGYSTRTVGEDVELVLRLHRHCRERDIPYRIRFVPDPVAWTEAPETLRVLGRQRDRWHRGLGEAIALNRGMLFNPRYGRIGLWVMPHYHLFDLWGPAVELLGYVVFAATLALGWASPGYVTVFLLLAIVLGIVLSITAVVIEELAFRRYPRASDLLRLFVLAIVESLGYRQLNLFWRLRGLVRYLRRVQGWGVMPRRGFRKAASAGAS